MTHGVNDNRWPATPHYARARLICAATFLLTVPARADSQAVNDTRAFVAAAAAAANGDPRGQFMLGEAYRQGRGADVDRPVAEDWYRRAATQGDAGAARQLGLMLGADREWRKAILWLTFANSGGDPKTTARLAMQAVEGSTEGDRQLALKLMAESAAGANVATSHARQPSPRPSSATKAPQDTDGRPIPGEPVHLVEKSHSAPTASANAPNERGRSKIVLQLGAYGTALRAEAAWLLAIKRLPSLSGRQHVIAPAGSAFRLQVLAASATDARTLASSLAAVGWQSIVERN